MEKVSLDSGLQLKLQENFYIDPLIAIAKEAGFVVRTDDLKPHTFHIIWEGVAGGMSSVWSQCIITMAVIHIMLFARPVKFRNV